MERGIVLGSKIEIIIPDPTVIEHEYADVQDRGESREGEKREGTSTPKKNENFSNIPSALLTFVHV